MFSLTAVEIIGSGRRNYVLLNNEIFIFSGTT